MERLKLVDALKKVMPGIGEKETLLEGTSSFMFDNEWIKTFNDTISVSYPFKTDIKCLVKAQEFFKILSKMENDEVTMIVEGEKLLITSGNTSLKMVITDSSNLTSLVDNLSLESSQWGKLPENFTTGLKSCTIFAATNKAYESLCSISVGKDGIISSDNFRAGWFHIDVDMEEEFILPIDAVKNLVQIENLIEYSQNTAWAQFRNKEGLYFSVRKISTDFPRDAIKGFLDFSFVKDSEEYSFPEKIKSAVERAAILSSVNSDGREYIEMLLDKKNNLIIKGSKQFGEIEDKIAPDEKWKFPKDLILKIDPRYFGDMLSIHNKFYVRDDKYILMRNGNFDSIVALFQ